MSEYQVLHGDPRHKVDEFRKEMLGRAALVVDEMGDELRKLVGEMMRRLRQLQSDLLLISMRGFKVAQTTWTKEGVLQIAWDFDRPAVPDPDLYNEVVDGFVDACLKQHEVPEELLREVGGFLRGMTMQFAVLAKHGSAPLRKIRFERVRWEPGLIMAFDLTLNGAPLRPRDVGW